MPAFGAELLLKYAIQGVCQTGVTLLVKKGNTHTHLRASKFMTKNELLSLASTFFRST